MQPTSQTVTPPNESPQGRLGILYRASAISDRILFGCFFVVVSSIVAEYGFYLSTTVTEWIRLTSTMAVWLLVLDYLVKLGVATAASLLTKSWLHLRRHVLRRWPHLVISVLIVFQQMVFLGWTSVSMIEDVDPAVWAQWYIAGSQFFVVMGFIVPLFKYSSRIAATRFHPSQSLVLGFGILVLVGTAALCLPKATHHGHALSMLDALFTATSAVCVTGLTVVDTGSHFTLTGQVILLLLIQMGGIGIITFATFFAMFFGSGMGFRERILVRDVLNESTYEDAVRTLNQILFVTFLLEAVGAAMLYYQWPETGASTPWHSEGEKIWFAIFHAVSAFCNAGFALTPDSLLLWSPWPTHGVLAALIVFGGLGFGVIRNLISVGYSRTFGKLIYFFRRMAMRKSLGQEKPITSVVMKDIRAMLEFHKAEISMQSKFVLTVSAFMIVGGALILASLEWHGALHGSILERWSHAFFQSVSARTAGFNTIDLAALGLPSIIIMIFLMFVGASPGSTGGGIKTTTFATMLISSFGNLSGRDRLHVYGRQIPQVAVVRSLMVITFSTMFLLVAIFLLSITEPGVAVERLLFEAVSAFATVGLSLGVTPSLSWAGKMIIIVSMFVGRLGTLSIAMSVATPRTTEKVYPEESVMIG